METNNHELIGNNGHDPNDNRISCSLSCHSNLNKETFHCCSSSFCDHSLVQVKRRTFVWQLQRRTWIRLHGVWKHWQQVSTREKFQDDLNSLLSWPSYGSTPKKYQQQKEERTLLHPNGSCALTKWSPGKKTFFIRMESTEFRQSTENKLLQGREGMLHWDGTWRERESTATQFENCVWNVVFLLKRRRTISERYICFSFSLNRRRIPPLWQRSIC